MDKKYTPGPWRPGKHGSNVIADSKDGLSIYGAYDIESKEYYGGYLIGESISKANVPLISAAPEMIETLIDHKKRISELRDLMDSQFPLWSHHRQLFNDLTNESEVLINKALGIET